MWVAMFQVVHVSIRKGRQPSNILSPVQAEEEVGVTGLSSGHAAAR